MNIKLKNKFLYFDEYRIKCAVGKRGITVKKIEGDNKTPAGLFKFKSIFYRKDRIRKIKTRLKKTIIKKNMGWCDDSNSKFYNKLINFPLAKYFLLTLSKPLNFISFRFIFKSGNSFPTKSST